MSQNVVLPMVSGLPTAHPLAMEVGASSVASGSPRLRILDSKGGGLLPHHEDLTHSEKSWIIRGGGLLTGGVYSHLE